MTAESQTVAVPRHSATGRIASFFARDPLAARILLVAAALGILSDPLFYDEPAGIQFPVFVSLALLALWSTANRVSRNAPPARVSAPDSRPEGATAITDVADPGPTTAHGWRAAAAAALAALTCAAFVFFRTPSVFTFGCVIATAALLAMAAALLHGPNPLRSSVATLAVAELWTLIQASFLPIQLTRRAVDFSLGRAGARSLLPIGRGVLLALPILFVFAGLFATADAVFEDMLAGLLDFAFLEDLVELAFRVFFMAAVAWAAAGWISSALRSTDLIGFLDDGPDGAAVVPGLRRWVRIGVPEAATLLVLVELLFGVFVVIQLAYLFGGERAIDVDGFTYAEYARRGFFELVAVAGLSLALLLGLNDLTKRVGPTQRRAFRLLATVLVGLVLVILVSAFKRLNLYEAAYGFTHLRLWVHAFIIWLGVALMWCAWSLWTEPRRFAAGALACAFGFVVTIGVMNPDALIVRRNMQRYETTGDLDIEYLGRLSSDAVPELLRALPALNEPERGQVEELLAKRLDQVREHRATTAGPGFNLAMWRALRALESSDVRDDLQSGHAKNDPQAGQSQREGPDF